jgi:hypothetical protein
MTSRQEQESCREFRIIRFIIGDRQILAGENSLTMCSRTDATTSHCSDNQEQPAQRARTKKKIYQGPQASYDSSRIIQFLFSIL